MANFKDYKVTINTLSVVIPDALTDYFSTHKKVNHYSKILHNKKNISFSFVKHFRK